MTENNLATKAVEAVATSTVAYCKFLSANDTKLTRSHQYGILISSKAKEILFSSDFHSDEIQDKDAEIMWQDDFVTQSKFKYYPSKKEYRITQLGHGFPYREAENTGDLFILTRHQDEEYRAFVLETDEDISSFLDYLGISPVDTNQLIDTSRVDPTSKEHAAINEYVSRLEIDVFPTSEELSRIARAIQNAVYDHSEYVLSNPDKKLISWTNTEYSLFRELEHARYGDMIHQGFPTVDAFINLANTVLNRRKSRAGKSLEHHLSAIFDANRITYSAQATTEGHKKPDFLFPSADAYHDFNFSEDRLASLAAKTTCKDRWRQVITEADRLRDKPKYLCTLQQGISPAQMDEMQEENVILVVPAQYIAAYPQDRQNRIWTLHKFIQYIREMEAI